MAKYDKDFDTAINTALRVFSVEYPDKAEKKKQVDIVGWQNDIVTFRIECDGIYAVIEITID